MRSSHHTRRFFLICSVLLLALALLIIVVARSASTGSSNTADTVVSIDSNLELIEDKVEMVQVPLFLSHSFPNTDFSDANPALASALSGGPVKDGIPAINDPAFIPLADYNRPGQIQAIVMNDNGIRKVYPYNILNWHEIVNDTVNDVPVSITFCPLCASAIVYDRTLPDGTVTTLGVSGGLLESNMIMYDRANEDLWQQSTGESLAGEFTGTKLDLVEFQLLTLADVRDRYPDALVLSEETGHRRDYGRNPYSRYVENDSFEFAPSNLDASFKPKEIMVVFRVDDIPVATPWLSFADGSVKEATISGKDLTLQKIDRELSIVTSEGERIPFYFEMWFSFAVQHDESAFVIE